MLSKTKDDQCFLATLRPTVQKDFAFWLSQLCDLRLREPLQQHIRASTPLKEWFSIFSAACSPMQGVNEKCAPRKQSRKI